MDQARPAIAPNGIAHTKRTIFSRETAVGIKVKAQPEVVWGLLTEAATFPEWNSTIVSLEGQIQLDETIQLKSTLDEGRVFSIKILEFDPHRRMVWGDRQGKRVFELIEEDGGTTFTMRERMGGPLFPLFARMIPPFDQAFEDFAADLKRAAEARK